MNPTQELLHRALRRRYPMISNDDLAERIVKLERESAVTVDRWGCLSVTQPAVVAAIAPALAHELPDEAMERRTRISDCALFGESSMKAGIAQREQQREAREAERARLAALAAGKVGAQ